MEVVSRIPRGPLVQFRMEAILISFLALDRSPFPFLPGAAGGDKLPFEISAWSGNQMTAWVWDSPNRLLYI